MTKNETLDEILKAYIRYYNIYKDDVEEPFKAKAVFASHNEQYFLIKAAKVADIDSNEVVYFALVDNLTEDDVNNLCAIAWDKGLANVNPVYGHRNSDVTLYIICDSISENVDKLIKNIKFSKNYKFGFFGWSDFNLVTIECSTNTTVFNRHGRSLKKLVGSIIN